MTNEALDSALERLSAGDRLSSDTVLELAASPDILLAGMLADAQKRVLHGTQVTYVRVTSCPVSDVGGLQLEAVCREVRLTGAPETLGEAVTATGAARAGAGGARTLSGFSWKDVVRWAEEPGQSTAHALNALRSAGLDALAEIAVDTLDSPDDALGVLADAGFGQVRLHVAGAAPSAERAALWMRVADAQARLGIVASLSPLPSVLAAFRPTTGYDDVKTIALARLAVPNVPHVQVDWQRYGPKLAQVALTFGADDVDAVSGSDAAPEGRRRAPLEEIRRNIEAAGGVPRERTGRFDLADA